MRETSREDLLERAITALTAATSESKMLPSDLVVMNEVLLDLRTKTDFMPRAEDLAAATISRSAVLATDELSSALLMKSYVGGLAMGIAATVAAVERGPIG